MRPFSFTKIDNAANALAAKKEKSQFIAGGTNLVDLMKKNIAQPEQVLDVTTALSSEIEDFTKGIRIGAMARNSALTTNAIVLEKYPLVSKAVLAGASPQIRNMASTAGNLLQRTRCPYFYDVTTACNKRKPNSGCSALEGENRMSAVIGYSEQCVAVHPSDLCVALAALDAKVNIENSKNKKSVISFGDFHRLPGNEPNRDNNLPENALITSVEIPSNGFQKHSAYLKIRDRDSYAFALVSVAAALELQGTRIVAARLASGGVAHKPWRWYDAEAFLKGKEATAANFSEAANIAVQDLKPLAHNGFKKEMLQGAIATALQQCLTV
ncbi:FAD binding domain-containing protein [Sphingobacterium hungaricum]|uniref:FAD-binding molybdopterin dehydrogenase n=1 Tax=Sphingobacterium hungaricum TaxID=2082723 RepID=A0A928UZU2_9SPHI|nr:xanthine dehydrogenase family protein subunit M [Sphingobacterium hungaricum]MBE8714470.1 FAD-binding molybdopterin dehydrogenase [Sphingobacterium hungaricum]